MTTQLQQVEETVVENDLMFQAGVKKSKIEKYVIQHISNSEISKERVEENDMIKEDIGHLLGDSKEPLVFEMNNGLFAVVQIKEGKKETLDKDALSYISKIDKEEFKHPLDYAMLISQGKITTDMIKDSMVKQDTETVSIKVLKTNPNKKRKNRK